MLHSYSLTILIDAISFVYRLEEKFSLIETLYNNSTFNNYNRFEKYSY